MTLGLGWYAPFLSNSGYGSEAISYLQAFQKYLVPQKRLEVAIRQFAEPENEEWTKHYLPPDLRRTLRALSQKRLPSGTSSGGGGTAEQQGVQKLASTSSSGAATEEDGATSTTTAVTGDEVEMQLEDIPYRGSGLAVVCHSTPDVWWEDGAFGWGGLQTRCPPPTAKIRIGRTMYETDTLPNSWVPRLNRMDYILVPSKWHYDIWKRKIKEHKLKVLHEAVDTEFFSPTATPQVPQLRHRRQHRLLGNYVGRLAQSEGGTTAKLDPRTGRMAQTVKKKAPARYHRTKAGKGHLHEHEQRKLQHRRYFDDDYAGDMEHDVHVSGEGTTDGSDNDNSEDTLPQPRFFLAVGKWEKRKGFDVLIKAFQEEFKTEAGIYLLIKTSLFHNTKQQILREAFGSSYDLNLERYQHVIVEDMPLSTVELVQLYREATAVVFPSRGEGWGRCHVEAMSTGRPVIATNFSGPTEYMREGNSLALNYTLAKETGREGRWAEPSVSHLRQQLRWVLNHREEAEAIGSNARKTMVDRFSLSAIAKQFEQLLVSMDREISHRDALLPERELRGRSSSRRDEL
ncbi:unnamed protein product [Amoebophrya sp. A25]|nr:unnamed protein product [Amoebophrya sp. A25]|eukprot:GSA25T00020345001.1